jgi:hypothetical protein
MHLEMLVMTASVMFGVSRSRRFIKIFLRDSMISHSVFDLSIIKASSKFEINLGGSTLFLFKTLLEKLYPFEFKHLISPLIAKFNKYNPRFS